MADDIDIEEHDLMDNPVLKKIFPDLSILKKEIQSYFEGEPGKKQDHESSICSGDLIIESEVSQIFKNNSAMVVESANYAENGSSTSQLPKNTTLVVPSLHPFQSNKIILGSKPTKKLEYEDFFKTQLEPQKLKLVLDDLGPYLDRSKRYCENCLILFPKRCDLAAHNKEVHFKGSIVQSNSKKNRKILQCKKQYICKKVRCNVCTMLFSSRGNLERHCRNVHKSLLNNVVENIKVNKIITRVKNNTNSKEQLRSNVNNTCFHCKKSFPSQHSLIEHLYKILQSKKIACKKCSQKFRSKASFERHMKLSHGKHNHSELIKKVTGEVRVSDAHLKSNNVLFYRCFLCSYYFKNATYARTHLVKTHKVTNYPKIASVPFDSKCRYCSQKFVNLTLYNAHLKTAHNQYFSANNCKELYNNGINQQSTGDQSDFHAAKSQELNCNVTDCISLLLKSILFKCIKCDIHFLSANRAMNHLDHMEMLINWKCSVCHRIFKKQDEKLHEKQHLFSHKFVVKELTELELARVLYNCTKCTVHFTEDKLLSHFSACGVQPPSSVYCKTCDILIDDSIGSLHQLSHGYENLKSCDFTIIDSDIIPTDEILKNPHIKNSKLNLIDKNTEIISNTEMLINSPIKNSNMKRKNDKCTAGQEKHIPKKKKYDVELLRNVTYCSTCKCFLTDSYKRRVHLQSRCGHLVKYVCKLCGLVLTAKSYQSHKTLHKTVQNLKLQDFNFFEIESGEQISPPIPEFPKCNNCEVYFVSQAASLSHDCNEENYLTCHICENKLSERAFKLHMSYHNYSNVKLKKETLTEHFSSKNKSSLNNITKTEFTQATTTLNVFKNDTNTNTCSKLQPNSSKDVSLVLTMESKKILKRNSNTNIIKETSLTPAMTNVTKNTNKKVTKKTILTPSTDVLKLLNDNNNYNNDSSDIDITRILFTCRNCHITVDAYDKVIEHCQRHYTIKRKKICETICNSCQLKFDSTCYENHQKIHDSESDEKESFKVFKFDTVYFTSENNVWISHIFGFLPPQQIDKIVNKSIYKFECRIKMEIIQEGSHELTVYQCDKCRSFISADSVYGHAESSCFKVRKHPCSYCGLPFISSVSRIEHEKIHKNMNIGLKSYRIVIFNKDADKIYSSFYAGSQRYVLFQCRNCNGVIDKCQIYIHECNHNNLKKCLDCGLLIYVEEYELHVMRHKELVHFTENNMKVILFGKKIDTLTERPNKMFPSFGGQINDYILYKCIRCDVCAKTVQGLAKHTCSFGNARVKCPNCNLYFVINKFKNHSKIHDRDPDFVLENMTIQEFDPLYSKVEHLEVSEEFMMNSNIIKTENHLVFPNECNDKDNHNMHCKVNDNSEITEKIAKIYKCTCGLHFLDEISLSTHFKMCNPKNRASKQKCSKCNLLFTPNILFSHLLMHHGNKKEVYRFDIIIENKNTFYQCSKCLLHFEKNVDVKEHYKVCYPSQAINNEGKTCNVCKLTFDASSMVAHHKNGRENCGNCKVLVVDDTDFCVSQDAPHTESLTNIDKDTVNHSQSKTAISDSDRTIYKCKKCNIYYITKKSLIFHLSEKHKLVTKHQDNCNICGLNFASSTLSKHLFIHHEKLKLQLGDFIIKENPT